jgi:hypothetical protein
MHYAPKILKHYLRLAVEDASPLDSDVHAELEVMTKAFDDLFGRMHTHEPEPLAALRLKTEAEHKLRDIADILQRVPVPVGGTVDGVRWLAKKHKERNASKHSKALHELHELEDLLQPSVYYTGPVDLKKRVRVLLSSESTARLQGNMMAEGHGILTDAGVPGRPGYLVARIRVLVKMRDLERRRANDKAALIKEIHEICDAAGVFSYSAPQRVQDLVNEVERLRKRRNTELGTTQNQLIDIARMAADAGVAEPNMPADKRVQTLIDEMHKAVDSGWISHTCRSIPLLRRVRLLAKQCRELRKRNERLQGAASDIKHLETPQTERIKQMLDDADLMTDTNVVTSVRKTIETVECLRGLIDKWRKKAQDRLDDLLGVSTILATEGEGTWFKSQATRLRALVDKLHDALTAAGAPENDQPLLSRIRALPDLDEIADTIENLEYEPGALRAAANVVRNWRD